MSQEKTKAATKKPAPGLMSHGLSTSAFLPPKPCDIPLTTNIGGSYASAASTHPVRWEAKESRPTLPQRRKEWLVFTSIMMEHQQASDVTQLYMDNIN
jgi:hypothetical protein